MKTLYLIVANTQVQLDVYAKNHGIKRDEIKRISDEHDLRGMATDRPLILLPDWGWHSAGVYRAVCEWEQRGGKTVHVTEAMVLGREYHRCPNDTNGDGDCHLCHRSGKCFWPTL